MILEAPFATREHILAAFRPGSNVRSDSPLKTLRKQHAVSGGLSIPLREAARLQGRSVLYSSLCVHAARLARHGLFSDAAALARDASNLEATEVAHLAAMAFARGEHDAPELRELALRTNQILLDYQSVLGGFLSLGGATVCDVGPGTVMLRDHGGEWQALRELVPDLLALPGTAVMVTVEHMGLAGVLVTVRPGIRTTGMGAARPSFASSSSGAPPVLVPLGPDPSGKERAEAIADALGSLRAEGLTPTPDVLELVDRLATGELTAADVRAEIRRRSTTPRG